MSRPIKWIVTIVALGLIFSAFAGYWAASMSLHPARRALSAELIAEADAVFRRDRAERTSFDVRAADGILLRGWLVQPGSHSNAESQLNSSSPKNNGGLGAPVSRCCG